MAKNSIGISFSSKTPTWVKWTYRIIFALTTAASFVIAADTAIPAETRVRINLYLTGFSMFAYAIGQGLGVKENKPDTDNP